LVQLVSAQLVALVDQVEPVKLSRATPKAAAPSSRAATLRQLTGLAEPTELPPATPRTNCWHRPCVQTLRTILR
jgi:hypothetical protein